MTSVGPEHGDQPKRLQAAHPVTCVVRKLWWVG